MATFEDYLFVKNTKWFIWGAGGVIVFLLVFRAGMVVGYHQALRFHGLERRPTQSGFFGLSMPPDGTIPGHGAVGTIATVTLPVIIIKTRDGMDERVMVDASTTILDASSNTLSASDLKPGDTVVILGDPNDADSADDAQEGEIDARIIHVFAQ